MAAEPRAEFPVTRRGYDRDHVDAYLERVGVELSTMAAENSVLRGDDALAQRKTLHADIEMLRARRTELVVEVAELETHVNDLRIALGRLLNAARRAVPPSSPTSSRPVPPPPVRAGTDDRRVAHVAGDRRRSSS
jgi:DivIVA domain-containing protein